MRASVPASVRLSVRECARECARQGQAKASLWLGLGERSLGGRSERDSLFVSSQNREIVPVNQISICSTLAIFSFGASL